MHKKHEGVQSLSIDEQNEICAIIGDWYLRWRDVLVDYKHQTHKLGFAKEELKEMICGSPEDEC
jgi:hypothetical protein